MESIPIWTGRSGGLDPTGHYWLDAGGFSERLCDGEPRGVQPDRSSPDILAPCGSCQDLYLEDVLYGRKAFVLLADPPEFDTKKNGVYTHKNMVYTPENGVYVEPKEVQMPRVSFGMFSRFYDERPAGQVRVVRDIRSRVADPKRYIQRDLYGPLRNTLRWTHWATGDIMTFENALPPFLAKQKKEFRRKHYEDIGQDYIAFWKAQDAMYFEIPAVDIEIGGLTIGVNPEVGLRTLYDYRVLKLWFNATKPTIRTRQVMEYLMGRAKQESDAWSDQWEAGIWDVRRQSIPLPRRIPQDFEIGVVGQVAAFLRIWTHLDEQAREGQDA